MEAQSTLAMTLYNLLAQAGAPRSARELMPLLTACHPSTKPPDAGMALHELARRGYVHALADDRYDLVDPMRRYVHARERSPGSDGWGQWRVRDKVTGALMPIDQAISQRATPP